MSEPEWSLLRLNPTLQPRFISHVTESLPHIPTYYPQYTKITRPARHRFPIETLTPVYPGYVFVCLDLDSISVHQITSTPVRAFFVRFGKAISIVPRAVIEVLREKEELNQLVVEKIIENPYYPGRRVRIIHPVATIQAIILHLVGQTHVRVDTPLGEATVKIPSVAL